MLEKLARIIMGMSNIDVCSNCMVKRIEQTEKITVSSQSELNVPALRTHDEYLSVGK